MRRLSWHTHTAIYCHILCAYLFAKCAHRVVCAIIYLSRLDERLAGRVRRSRFTVRNIFVKLRATHARSESINYTSIIYLHERLICVCVPKNHRVIISLPRHSRTRRLNASASVRVLRRICAIRFAANKLPRRLVVARARTDGTLFYTAYLAYTRTCAESIYITNLYAFAYKRCGVDVHTNKTIARPSTVADAQQRPHPNPYPHLGRAQPYHRSIAEICFGLPVIFVSYVCGGLFDSIKE